jgi:biotin transport system substrate-specific component
MSALSGYAPENRSPVLADLIAPSRVRSVNDFLLNAVMVLGGAGFVALLAQITIPTVPVPVTAQTLGVILVGSALGASRGTISLAVYVLLGFFLPIYADGASGTVAEIGSIAGASGGYLIGFVFAAGLVGWLSEHGDDRRVITALGSYVVGLLVIFAFGLVGLKLAAPALVEAGFMASTSWSTVIEDGFTFFIGWEVLKALAAALLMPAAWKLADLRNSRDSD